MDVLREDAGLGEIAIEFAVRSRSTTSIPELAAHALRAQAGNFFRAGLQGAVFAGEAGAAAWVHR